MFQMLGVFAEFERGIIRERVNAGLARAREKGVKLGRPRIDPRIERRIRQLRKKGYGILKIGRELGSVRAPSNGSLPRWADSNLHRSAATGLLFSRSLWLVRRGSVSARLPKNITASYATRTRQYTPTFTPSLPAFPYILQAYLPQSGIKFRGGFLKFCTLSKKDYFIGVL